MARGRKKSSQTDPEVLRNLPAYTQEDLENQAIAAAMDLAYQQIMDGTASQQIIVHFLRAGSLKQRMELEKLRDEKKLLQAKVKNLESQEATEQLYREAIKAFQVYSGSGSDEDYDSE
jgi:cell division protein FtsB